MQAEKRQQALSAECADLKQQLADANHSIHLLTGQAQQKDDSLAAKDASLQQLSIEKQALLQDKQQLLTQLSTAQQDLFTERQQVAVLQEKQQQTQHRVQELQQQLEEQAAAAATQEENIEQLIEEYQQERAKLAEAQVKLQEASHDSERAKERCGALEQQLEEQGQDAEALLQRCMVCGASTAVVQRWEASSRVWLGPDACSICSAVCRGVRAFAVSVCLHLVCLSWLSTGDCACAPLTHAAVCWRCVPLLLQDQQQQLEQLQAKVDSQKSALHQAQQALSEHMDGNEEKVRG